MPTDKDEEFAFVTGHGPHAIVIASDRGTIGCAYGGMIVRSGAGWLALPSRDLVRLGVVDYPGSHHATLEGAEKALGEHAIALSRKMVHGLSGLGKGVVLDLVKPILIGKE